MATIDIELLLREEANEDAEIQEEVYFDLAESWEVSDSPLWFPSRKGTESTENIWLSERHFGRHRYNRNGGRKPRRNFGRKARRCSSCVPADEFAPYEERFAG